MRDTYVRWHWCKPSRVAAASFGVKVMIVAALSVNAGDAHAKESEYSFDWLDPDKQVYVLQNRKYLKGGRILISGMAGMGLSELYRDTYTLDPRVAYYINEAFGVEAFYSFSMNTPNGNLSALEEASTTIPMIREVQSSMGLLAHWSPWYAKINVFNTILHFDWYFTAGGGQLQTRLNTEEKRGAEPDWLPQNLFAAYVGTGHQYHLSQHAIVRLDLTGAFYRAPIFGNEGPDTWFSSFTFNVGAGVRF